MQDRGHVHTGYVDVGTADVRRAIVGEGKTAGGGTCPTITSSSSGGRDLSSSSGGTPPTSSSSGGFLYL